MTIFGILENLISDILFLFLAVLLGWLWLTVTKRRKLLNFFGVTDNKRIVIYLSNLRVLLFGSVGITGKKMSYQGEAVPYGEMLAASQIQHLFSFIIPALAEASKTIGRIFLSDVSVQILVSPEKIDKLDTQASIVSLGSSAYNVASLYVEQLSKGMVKFRLGSLKLDDLLKRNDTPSPLGFSDTDPGTYLVTDSTFGTASITKRYLPEDTNGSFPTGTPLKQDEDSKEEPSAILIDGIPPITETTKGFILRIKDENGRSFFCATGLSEYSTKGSAYYLASEWPILYKKYGKEKSFLIMLEFDGRDITRWSIAFEKSLSLKGASPSN